MVYALCHVLVQALENRVLPEYPTLNEPETAQQTIDKSLEPTTYPFTDQERNPIFQIYTNFFRAVA